MKKNLVFAVLMFVVCIINAQDKLIRGQNLLPGQSLTSANGKYKLIYQTDGNLVIYRNRDNFPLWSTKTHNQPAGRCSMQQDGNLVIYKPDGSPIWASIKNWNTPDPCRGDFLIMQDDANAVIYDNNHTSMWSSGTYLEAINDNLHGVPCPNGQIVLNSQRTAFNPQVHGFKFTNDFTVEFEFGFGIKARYGGQCGGMAYSALDYFKSNRPIPTQGFRPFTGSILQSYIYSRQISSLKENVDKWSELILNPFGWRTNEYFNWGIQGFNGGRIQELRQAIDAGNPIPLGLFKAGSGGNVAHHQVLAIGYDMGRYRGDLGEFKEDFKIFIYDPNHPNETVTLRPHVGGDSFYAYDEYPNERWQTYFVDKKYQPAQPPQIDFPVMQSTGNVSQIMLEIRTGGDDLRGNKDNVNVVINFTDGTSQIVNNINNGGRWIDNYDQAVPIRLNQPRPRNQIRDITLSTTFSGGFDGDNWNVDSIRIGVIDGNSSDQVFLRSGTPLVRFTGSNTPFVCRL
ncbi:MAG: hypothetical protein JNM22_12140 [Saprospiraceae bacterium]|nr:hypothetical protein [Saprospiraceae bacterium]